MRQIKKEIRILGIDDAPFEPRSKGRAIVIGTVFRGGTAMDGMIKTEVTIDGTDATKILVKKINSSKHKEQLRIIMIDGITLGGFNVVDIAELYRETKIPIIAVNRKKPDLPKIKIALKRFPDFENKWQATLNAGKFYKLQIEKNKSIYYQFVGLEKKEAIEILKKTCLRGLVPEPLRIAHLIGSAFVKGESGGRA